MNLQQIDVMIEDDQLRIVKVRFHLLNVCFLNEILQVVFDNLIPIKRIK
jgi:hypothetical protein